ncbi:MAG: 23S rRNA (adenine(2503)-C(2))-methyltransferase RlmN, partial [Candidatus Omnitrophica bacterium]|nr:23S rRNA (adenine(2503)-C(2))-methyltransferase RlmN [Candidatus Omnitrophota bacterium]
MDLKLTLYGLDLEEAETFAKAGKVPAYRGRQLLEWLYKKHIASLEEAVNLPREFRDSLSAHYDLAGLSFDEAGRLTGLESTKFLFKTRDGHLLESVLIVQKDRKTVCVSTQLGCKIGCPFCASGQGKFIRNLTAGEIIEQVVWIEKQIKVRVTNVV